MLIRQQLGGSSMIDRIEQATHFRSLHDQPGAFLIPNPWDVGSARILEGMGFVALATSSAGYAFTQGLLDGHITREQAIAHIRDLAQAVEIPISADLENGFGDTPQDTAETIRAAGEAGAVGGSIEDSTGNSDAPVYEFLLAVERVAAAVEAAQALPFPFVLTARAENHIKGRHDLDDTIRRLTAYEAAGADVLYAPGLPDLEAVRTVCGALSKPVNVLVTGPLANHSVEEFADAGATRLSLGSTLMRHVLGHLNLAAREMLDSETFGFMKVMGGRQVVDKFMR